MTENPSDPSGESPTSDDAGTNQSDIDALFGGPTADPDAEETHSPTDGADDASAQAEPVTQADIDILLSGAAGAEEVQQTAVPADSTSPSDSSAQAVASTPADTGSTGSDQDPAPEEQRLDTLGRPFDQAAAEMATAMAAEQSDTPPVPTSAPAGALPLELSDIDADTPPAMDTKRVTMLNDVNLRVRIQLGQTRMLVEDVLNLSQGSVVELDKLAGDPVDVIVNDRLIARGEVLVLNDSFCVRISEVLSHDPHRVST